MTILRLAALLALTQAVLAANKYCDEAYFWYPDGSREIGNADWSSGPFAAGPCLQVSGIGMTQTFKKTVLVIDRTDFTNTYMPMPGTDQLAFAEEVNLAVPAKTQRPLNVLTNTFCSSGQHGPGGRFFSVGGDMAMGGYIQGKGGFSMRLLEPCVDGKCDFIMNGQLTAHRWYPTTQLLPDGRMLIVGGASAGVAINGAGTNVPSLEYYPAAPGAEATPVPFLTDTLPYNLYPFVHLLPNGLVFIFAADQYILWNTKTNAAVDGNFPALAATDAAGNRIVRSYPLPGTSAMFPLSPKNGYHAEIMVCGGSATTGFAGVGERNENAPADNKCWRISPLALVPKWEMETMKLARVMPLCVLLPDGHLFIHGGAATGFSGIPNGAHNASLSPELYDTKTHTWFAGPTGTSKVPRVYHASAVALHDGSVFISGSNPHQDVIHIIGDDYPTEMRSEFYFPPYFRAVGIPPAVVRAPAALTVGTNFYVTFRTHGPVKTLSLVLQQPGFSTHNNNHGMRSVELAVKSMRSVGGLHSALVAAPPNHNICPPTYYWMFVVVNGVPNRDGHYVIVAK